MDLEERDDFLGRWADGRLTDEEKRAFEASDDFKIYQKILEGSSGFAPGSYDTEKSLKATKNRLRHGPKSIQRSMVSIWSVAAAVLLLFVSYFVYTSSSTSETSIGELAEEILPDGSKVSMNAKTKLKYQRRNWKSNRNVSLVGEAFFEVAKGSAFTVESPIGKVEVLGTKFNVYARENIFEVRCFEGKVKVVGVEEMYLAAGASYRQIEGKVEAVSLTNNRTPEWINYETVFKNSPVSNVLLGLTDQYGLSFEGNIPPDSVRVTVSFPNDNQELAIDLVFKSLQRSYQRKSEKVIFVD